MGHQLLLVLLTVADPTHVSWVWPHGIHGPVLLRFYVSLVGFSSDFLLNLSVPEASILGLLCLCVFSWGNLFTSFLSFWCSNQHSWFWSPLSCRLKWSTCHWMSPMHVSRAPRNLRGWNETPHFSLTWKCTLSHVPSYNSWSQQSWVALVGNQQSPSIRK